MTDTMKNRILLAIAAAAVPAGGVFADDLTPPPWRFSAGSTFQHWDFSAGPIGGPPDAGVNNPYGNPIFAPGTGPVFLPVFGARSDLWQLPGQGQLTFEVPNLFDQTHSKELWLQVTYFAPGLAPTVAIPGWTLAGQSSMTLADGFTHTLFQFTFPTCPSREIVTISSNTAGITMMVDQVVIDTRCVVPTPGAAGLLALSGVMFLGRRRRA